MGSRQNMPKHVCQDNTFLKFVVAAALHYRTNEAQPGQARGQSMNARRTSSLELLEGGTSLRLCIFVGLCDLGQLRAHRLAPPHLLGLGVRYPAQRPQPLT